ncbi:MAG: DoxX family protein [Rhodococcus sp.]|nr:DoxX family protein [Rhodococcus sp. (in: high G+C Gram-positive bacteria)]
MTGSTTARNIGLLIGRIGIGAIFLAHGLQKVQNGQEAMSSGFESMGVPLPAVSAFLVTWLEVLGGIALIVGALVPVVGALFVIVMAGAYFSTHADNGLWVSDGGYELVLALGAASLILAVVGSGRFGVDGLLGGKLPFGKKKAAVAA